MSTKTANVSVRVQPEIKEQAEQILEKIGIPVSVLVDTLYRQIIMTGSIPYSLSIPRIQTIDDMTTEHFNSIMQSGYEQAGSEQGVSVDEAFKRIKNGI